MCSLINTDSGTSDSNSEREHQLRRNNSVQDWLLKPFRNRPLSVRLPTCCCRARCCIGILRADSETTLPLPIFIADMIVGPTRRGLAIFTIHGKNGSRHCLSLHYDLSTSRLNFGPDFTLASASSLMGRSRADNPHCGNSEIFFTVSSLPSSVA